MRLGTIGEWMTGSGPLGPLIGAAGWHNFLGL